MDERLREEDRRDGRGAGAHGDSRGDVAPARADQPAERRDQERQRERDEQHVLAEDDRRRGGRLRERAPEQCIGSPQRGGEGDEDDSGDGEEPPRHSGERTSGAAPCELRGRAGRRGVSHEPHPHPSKGGGDFSRRRRAELGQIRVDSRYGDSTASRSSTVSRRRITRASPPATSTAAGRGTALYADAIESVYAPVDGTAITSSRSGAGSSTAAMSTSPDSQCFPAIAKVPVGDAPTRDATTRRVTRVVELRPRVVRDAAVDRDPPHVAAICFTAPAR